MGGMGRGRDVRSVEIGQTTRGMLLTMHSDVLLPSAHVRTRGLTYELQPP